MCMKATVLEFPVGERTALQKHKRLTGPIKRKMSFASDKLYNGYLRRNMSSIVSMVKVREIIIHLPCLTAHDRENIEAKRETCGNYDGMVLLLDCLKRRENWPEQFIKALEACEHTRIAAEIRAEYNALKVVNNSSSGSSPTTVTRAHVHPTPAASNVPIPEIGGAKSQAAVPPPAEAPPALSEPAAQTPAVPKTPQGAGGQVSTCPPAVLAQVSPPELVLEPPQPADIPPLPSTPPPSPEIPRSQATNVPLQQDELDFHQEHKVDIQDVSGDTGPIPDEANRGNKAAATLQPQPPATLCGTDTVSSAASVINDKPPQSTTRISLDATDVSSFSTMSLVKHPVQDTGPPVSKVSNAVLQPEKTSGPAATKIVKSIPETEPAASASPGPPADDLTTSMDDVFLSKPTQLVSILPQNPAQASSQTEQPFSGNTERLEISEAAADTLISTHSPIYAAANPVTALSSQENGVAPNHNEPEENHYESPDESMVLEGHFSEVPSILNLDGQTTAPQLQLINGETAKEVISAPPASVTNTGNVLSSLNSSCSQSCGASEPGQAGVSPDLKSLQNSEGHAASESHFTPSKHVLMAAGVGACALLMAWRLTK